MDIQMPRMDGLAATRKIRQWETAHGLPPVPISALTASVLDEDVRCAVAAGCNLHIGKPVKKRALLDTIRNAALLGARGAPVSSAAADPAPLAETQKFIRS